MCARLRREGRREGGAGIWPPVPAPVSPMNRTHTLGLSGPQTRRERDTIRKRERVKQSLRVIQSYTERGRKERERGGERRQRERDGRKRRRKKERGGKRGRAKR